jgi:hypothetical protein
MMPEESAPRGQGRDEDAFKDAPLHGAALTIDDIASIRIAEGFGNGTIVPPHLKTDQAAMEGAMRQETGTGLESH